MSGHRKSFLRGMLCASLTWGMSIYLYWLLTSSNEDYSTNEMIPNEGPSQKTHHYLSKEKKEFLLQKMNFKNHIFMKSHRESGNSIMSDNLYDHKGPIKSDYAYNNTKIWQNNKKSSDNSINISNDHAKNLGKSNIIDEDGYGFIKTPEERRIRDEGYKIYAFNVLASQRIGDTRVIPDTRHALCKSRKFPSNLPDVSVVICFYNEHFQTLTRSIKSILDRTPHKLLKEIILVDDYSDVESLHVDVKNYVYELSHLLAKTASLKRNKVLYEEDTQTTGIQVRLLKTEKREGLIRARLFGAENATGKVLVFLDSHIEVNVEWLEPLLVHLAENLTNNSLWSSRVAIPIIDVINADTFQYKSSPLVRGGFNWGLHFKWDNLPKGTLETKEDFIKPLKSPTMAGGLFAIYRKYFNLMGKYDSGMDTWGGENLEMSFRIWMCGGSLHIIPCSRVGHVFRKRRPYGSADGKGDSMMHNSLRLAHVWMDSYVDHYLKKNPSAISESYGDISDRVALRKSLNCKSFKWYLDNVYPEFILDTDSESKVNQKINLLDTDNNKFQPRYMRKRNYVTSFQMRLSNTSLCIQTAKDIKTKGSFLMLAPCTKTINQIWYETALKELILGRLLCLEAPASGDKQPMLAKCHEMSGTQEWHRKQKNGEFIYNVAAGTCLGVDEKMRSSPVIMKICTNTNLIFWDFIYS